MLTTIFGLLKVIIVNPNLKDDDLEAFLTSFNLRICDRYKKGRIED